MNLNSSESRDESYYNVGKAVVCSCNLLIAIWNNEPAGKGGTENIVNYACRHGGLLFWIYSNT